MARRGIATALGARLRELPPGDVALALLGLAFGAASLGYPFGRDQESDPAAVQRVGHKEIPFVGRSASVQIRHGDFV